MRHDVEPGVCGKRYGPLRKIARASRIAFEARSLLDVPPQPATSAAATARTSTRFIAMTPA
jgi:hypothetical protein